MSQNIYFFECCTSPSTCKYQLGKHTIRNKKFICFLLLYIERGAYCNHMRVSLIHSQFSTLLNIIAAKINAFIISLIKLQLPGRLISKDVRYSLIL